eukprot:gene13132-biopygen13525
MNTAGRLELNPPVVQQQHGCEMSPPAVRQQHGCELSPPAVQQQHGCELNPPAVQQQHGCELSPPAVQQRHGFGTPKKVVRAIKDAQAWANSDWARECAVVKVENPSYLTEGSPIPIEAIED